MNLTLNSKKVLFVALVAILFSACFISLPTEAEATCVYSVTYNPNGANGPVYKDSYKLCSTYTIRQNMYTREGYTFTGWNTRADGKGTNYAPGYKIKCGSLCLYAQWIKNDTKISVTYYPNGGTGSNIIDNINPATIYTIRQNTFTRTGYAFIGWNTNANGNGTNYSPGQVIQLTSSINLYAQWKKCPYTITYNPNGGTGQNIIDYSLANASYTIRSNTFTREGYTFTGWNTNANGNGTSYIPGQVINVTRSLTLYAQWKKINGGTTYTVTYLPNEASGSSITVQVPAGSNHYIMENTYIMPGYYFENWSTSTDNGTRYIPGQSITVNGNLTLYARWIPGV